MTELNIITIRFMRDEKILKQVKAYSEKLTRYRKQEDIENNVPPSRHRRPVSLASAAKKLIEKGLNTLEKEGKHE